MNKYEIILFAWCMGLTTIWFMQMIKISIIERVLHALTGIVIEGKRKSKVDALYGRNND